MITEAMKVKAVQAREDGYIAITIGGGNLTLEKLILFLGDIFPNHTLAQLAITEAKNGEIVVSAQLGVSTKGN